MVATMAAMVTLSRLSVSESESEKQERDERKLIDVWANSLEELDRKMITRISQELSSTEQITDWRSNQWWKCIQRSTKYAIFHCYTQ